MSFLRQVADRWGTKVVERLSNDLRAEFAGMRGLSPGTVVAAVLGIALGMLARR